MFARTPRLLLRPGWAEDASALARSIRSEARSANALADAEVYLAAPNDLILPRFLVILRTPAAPLVIGTTGLTRRASGRVEYGCWIDEAHRGRGFATEAGRALLDIAATLGLVQVEASHFFDHPASGRLLAKLGFTTTGLTAPRYNCRIGADANARLMRIMLGTAREAAPLAA